MGISIPRPALNYLNTPSTSPKYPRKAYLGGTYLPSQGIHPNQPTHVLCTQAGQIWHHRWQCPRMPLSNSHCSDNSRQNRNYTHITWG